MSEGEREETGESEGGGDEKKRRLAERIKTKARPRKAKAPCAPGARDSSRAECTREDSGKKKENTDARGIFGGVLGGEGCALLGE